MVTNSTNINKTKKSLSSDGQQLQQYQQNKGKFKPGITTSVVVVSFFVFSEFS
jgi:hypothetical protein